MANGKKSTFFADRNKTMVGGIPTNSRPGTMAGLAMNQGFKKMRQAAAPPTTQFHRAANPAILPTPATPHIGRGHIGSPESSATAQAYEYSFYERFLETPVRGLIGLVKTLLFFAAIAIVGLAVLNYLSHH